MNAPSTKKKSAAAQMRQQALDQLRSRGITFAECNGGAHLIVQGSQGHIDFWPGAGRWNCRVTSKQGYGCDNLIRYVKGF